MGSKFLLFLGFTFAVVLLISSAVAARELNEAPARATKTLKNDKEANVAEVKKLGDIPYRSVIPCPKYKPYTSCHPVAAPPRRKEICNGIYNRNCKGGGSPGIPVPAPLGPKEKCNGTYNRKCNGGGSPGNEPSGLP